MVSDDAPHFSSRDAVVCRGVGKTWAMLSAAQRERAAGRDVLIGVVETHGRSETAARLAGLDTLPQRHAR